MSPRRGTVLLAVLVVVALTAMIAAGLLFRMTAEVSAGAAEQRSQQARAAAMSGLQRVLDVLRAHGDDPDFWSDNPSAFKNQLVFDDGSERWYFTVFAPSAADPGTVRYGPTDESGKINLNAAPPQVLVRLPNLTEELADCLQDYRDSDSQPRPGGAEQPDYYDTLSRPYVIRNGPLATLDELLMVKGFTARIVYGEDANLNGLLEPNEDDGDDRFPPDNRDGQLDASLRGVATVFSYTPLTGQERKVNLNDPNADLSSLGLPDQTIQFIRTYLAEGNRFKHPSELLEMRYQAKGSPEGSRGRSRRRSSESTSEPATENTTEDAEAAGGEPGGWIFSYVGKDELPIVMSKLTTETRQRGRLVGPVNANTASVAVLALLPGLDEETARSIVEARRGLDPETKGNLAWLYTKDAVDAATFRSIAPLLTTRGWQYHVQVVGFGSPSGRYCVLEAVADLAGTPRVAYLRDMTRLGLPFAIDPRELEQ